MSLRFAVAPTCKSTGLFLAVLTARVGIGMNTSYFHLLQDIFMRGLHFYGRSVSCIYGDVERGDLKTACVSSAEVWHYREGTNRVLEHRCGMAAMAYNDRIGARLVPEAP